MTFRELLKEGMVACESAGVPDAAWDAAELLEYAGGPDRTHYPLEKQKDAPEEFAERYRSLIARRAAREPLQQITKTAYFMGLPFFVNDRVLCPRQDTERLVEIAAEKLGETSGKANVLDLCCGSGCAGLSLLHQKQDRIGELALFDISEEALAVAGYNTKRLFCEAPSVPIRLVKSDLLHEARAFRFDLIICNPPYIPSGEIGSLMPEVRDHEPHLALDGGADGLDFYRRLAEESQSHLASGGRLLMEIGCDQAEAVRKLFVDQGWDQVSLWQDYEGRSRVIGAAGPRRQKPSAVSEER